MKRLLRIGCFILLSLPKTIYFNLRTFPFRLAIRFPILVGYNVKVLETHKNIIELPGKIHPGIISIGYGGVRGVATNSKGYICLEKGKVTFKGSAVFAAGSSIRVNGDLIIGDNFNANKNCFISCSDQMIIGKDVLLGWNCSIRDSDGHTVIFEDNEKQSHASVVVGNHVWICSEAHILKGVTIGDDSVVAYRSLVTKGCGDNCLMGGSPAKIISEKISWKY